MNDNELKEIIINWLEDLEADSDDLIDSIKAAGGTVNGEAGWEHQYRIAPKDGGEPGAWFEAPEGRVDESVANYAKEFDLTVERRRRRPAGEPGPWESVPDDSGSVESGPPRCNYRWFASDYKRAVLVCSRAKGHFGDHKDETEPDPDRRCRFVWDTTSGTSQCSLIDGHVGRHVHGLAFVNRGSEGLSGINGRMIAVSNKSKREEQKS